MTITGDKFKVGEKVFFSPRKGNYVTIDTYNGTDAFGDDYNNSAEEWCVEIDGELSDFVAERFETFTGFIKLFSRRYACYTVDCQEFMNENGYDAVFVDGDMFYFCGNEVANEEFSAYDLKNDNNVDFWCDDYGDDCLGWHDLFYVHNGKLFTIDERQCDT